MVVQRAEEAQQKVGYDCGSRSKEELGTGLCVKDRLKEERVMKGTYRVDGTMHIRKGSGSGLLMKTTVSCKAEDHPHDMLCKVKKA